MISKDRKKLVCDSFRIIGPVNSNKVPSFNDRLKTCAAFPRWLDLVSRCYISAKLIEKLLNTPNIRR